MLNYCGALRVVAFLAVLIAALPGQAAKAGNKCTDISLAVTMPSMPPAQPAGIFGDGVVTDSSGNTVYTDGQPGVSAKIQMCNGYYDAVIQFGSTHNTTRFVNYSFSGSTLNYIPGVTPSWTQSDTVLSAQPLFNINQIADPAHYQPGANYAFTTYMWNGQITGPGPDGGAYRLYYVSSDPLSNTGYGYVNASSGIVNTPYSTSLVQVTHSAATGSSPETWVVIPIANCAPGACNKDQYPGVVATLLSDTTAKGTTTSTNVGQFSMPFTMTLTRR